MRWHEFSEDFPRFPGEFESFRDKLGIWTISSRKQHSESAEN